jgi:hypothetical protein
MRLLRVVRRYPIAVLAVFALAFVVWVWRDALPGAGLTADQTAADSLADPNWVAPPRRLPLPPDAIPPVKPDAQALSQLKPGMKRAEVEKLVGAPGPNDVHPVLVADGKVIYHATYEADLGPAPTVRPIHPGRTSVREAPPQPPPGARTLVTLEYDATRPGHPLLEVYYPDPLF